MKRLLCLFLIFTLLLLLSSCWDRKEPKDLSIIQSSIYDIKEDGSYIAIGEVLNPSQNSSQPGSGNPTSNPSIIAVSEGPSLAEAIRNTSLNHGKSFFSGHSKVRFFTERFIKKDQLSSMVYFLRAPLFDEKAFVVMIKGENTNPISIYGVDIGLSDNVGNFIENISKSQPDQNFVSVFTSNLDFIIDYYEAGKQPVMGVVEIVTVHSVASQENASTTSSSNSKQRLRYEGLAAFKDNQFVGYMNGEETRAYNLITDNVKSSCLTVNMDQNPISILIMNSKPTIHTRIEDKIPFIDLNITLDFAIVQESGFLNAAGGKNIFDLEKAVNKKIQEQIEKSIERAQKEFVSDIFGFGTVVHNEHPKEWVRLEKNWDDYFEKSVINVEIDGTNTKHGIVNQPFEKRGERK